MKHTPLLPQRFMMDENETPRCHPACRTPGAQAHTLHVGNVGYHLTYHLYQSALLKSYFLCILYKHTPSYQPSRGELPGQHTWRPLPCCPHLPSTTTPCSGKANTAGNITQRTTQGGQHEASTASAPLQTSESREFISCYIYHTISAITRVKVQIAAASQTHWGWMEPISFKDEWEE